jgi:hypothetical protein
MPKPPKYYNISVGNDCKALVNLTQVVVARTHFVSLFSNLEKEGK